MEGYTIQSARFANKENTVVEAVTAEAGAVMISEPRPGMSEHRAALWAHLQEWLAKGNAIEAHVAAAVDTRDLAAELDELKTVLVQKSVITAEEIDREQATPVMKDQIRGGEAGLGAAANDSDQK